MHPYEERLQEEQGEQLSALRRSTRHRPMRRTLTTLAAVLMVGVLIGSALLLFTQRGHQMSLLAEPTGTPGLAGPVGTPGTTQVDWAGLKMSMQVTPGPYFWENCWPSISRSPIRPTQP
jgi:hypothetical protein